MKIVVILIGAPGSGKGTQSEELKKRLNLAHLSTGDMLRDEVNSNSELGKEIKTTIAEGKLVSDNIMREVITNRIKKDDCKKGFILDGYPRNTQQVNDLDKVFVDNDIEDYKVIELVISEEVLTKRILGRFMCSQCKAIYNEYTAPTKVAGTCDVCGSTAFTKRSDDNINTIKERFEVYYKQTMPVLEKYKERKKYYAINAEEDKDVSLNSIINLLK